MRLTNLILVTSLAAGCRARETADHPAADTAHGATGMVMRSDSLVPRMRAHLDSLVTATAPTAAQPIATHDAMASQMLDAMGIDMAMMGMRADSVWTALADSVKRDLAELPTLIGRHLDDRVKAHAGRMRRLLDMHAAMMQH